MIYNVAIVGGGVSGLVAAKYLTSLGLKVCLLEGRNRLGGRIHTLYKEDIQPLEEILELGALYLEGTGTQDNPNPLLSLFERFGIQTTSVDSYNADTFDANARPCQLKEIITELQDKIDNITYAIKTSLTSLKESTLESSSYPSIASILNYDKNNVPVPDSEDYWIRKLTSTTMIHHTGAELEQISMLEFLSKPMYEGSERLVLNGYQKLIDGLYEETLATGNLSLFLNHRIREIQHHSSDGLFKLATDSGNSFEAESVLCAVPLGVLKKGIIQFSPKLSSAKHSAIQHLGVGNHNVVILQFKHAFWPKEVQFLYPNDLDVSFWPEYLNLNAVKEDSAPILLANFYGNPGKFINKSNSDIIKMALAPLQRVYKDKVAPLVSASLSRWDSDHFSFGSQPFCGVHCSQQDLYSFHESSNNDGLYFAGDYCLASEHGTINAAYESGLQAAMEIEVYLNNKERLRRLKREYKQH